MSLSLLQRITRFLWKGRLATTWDGLYASGETRRYEGLEQFARYAVIEGYCKWLGKPAALLEIGCGTGILPSRMDKRCITDYCGMDISGIAIDEARAKYPEGRFIVAAAESHSFDEGTFDIVIFNESLSCIRPIESHFRRYLGYLRPGGHAVVSITGLEPEAQQVFESSMADQIISQTTISDRQSGKSWKVYLVGKEGKVPAALRIE